MVNKNGDMRVKLSSFTVAALFFGHSALAVAETTRLTPQALAGAWVQQGTKCADRSFTVVYLPDGRTYNGLTSKGFAGGGLYKIEGRNLTVSTKTEPAFRRGSPYEDKYLSDTRLVTRISKDRIDFNYPGNRNPDLTTPSFARCPESAGPEPWFPKLRYSGFAPERLKIPAGK